ncbi:MAG TPA: CRISPR-associated helicase Cas3' [Bacillota bacterium]|nr:CRISPR-associated helicase Cas3' [Bacillota bacterium]HOP54237.1 CRISPR-associated helicase Cas3' [Bacillota bacterium]HPT60973.1 CRISPR-associated helicase Cas3' [Bacillota bacterium]HPZ72292.1 CRISPR-associated helicase Cas3' [Bacillota bacterium]
MTEYFAHSAGKSGRKEYVIEHLTEVAKHAQVFAAPWGAESEAYVAALAHDLGKYSQRFQQVLEKQATRIDHATPGAKVLLEKYKNAGFAAALAVEGHHEGIKRGSPKELLDRIRMDKGFSETQSEYSERDIQSLIERLLRDGGILPDHIESSYLDVHKDPVRAQLYVRMLFSALTDADFLATEAHFNRTNDEYEYRKMQNDLNEAMIDKVLDRLLSHIEKIKKEKKSSSEMQSLRDDLLENCLKKASLPTGVFTLTAPTGSGKTFSMLAFALTHAKEHRLRRLIFVLPYINIIDQMAKQFKDVVNQVDEGVFVLEDHSLVEIASDSDELKYLAENWDAPIIITTSVRFFESLFANRSNDCRKLHNIAKSVILFDEAQTMPSHLAPPSLIALSELVDRYGCTVVFSTATQPAFTSLNPEIAKLSANTVWKPTEIVDPELKLFQRSKKVDVEWIDGSVSFEKMAEELSSHKQCLVIVNLRRHAKELFKKLDGKEGAYHLSTDMCPSHRLAVLREIENRLRHEKECIVISTQCVEAGVDLDFPVVYRAMGPLDSIVQAAGRCNRNGRQDLGKVKVFVPTEEKYPTTDYRKATVELKRMLLELVDFDISDPKTIEEYYKRYFSTLNYEAMADELYSAIKSYDYPDVARRFKWIADQGINVLVPYKQCLKEYYQLAEAARSKQINAKWLKSARLLSVGAYAYKGSDIYNYLEPVVDRHGAYTNWFILLDESKYSEQVGLDIVVSLEDTIA